MCALTIGFDTEELAFSKNSEGLFEPGYVYELNRRRVEDNAWHALKLSVGTPHLSARAAVSHCTLTWAEILVFTLAANKEQQHKRCTLLVSFMCPITDRSPQNHIHLSLSLITSSSLHFFPRVRLRHTSSHSLLP